MLRIPPSRERSVSASTSKKKASGTITLESLLLHSSDGVKIYRKCFDRKSGKPLYKLAKFKIVRVTNNTYITNTGKVYRKTHIALKRNVNLREILAKISTAVAPTRGVRVGQMPPRKLAPRGQTVTPTQRCPITIISAPHQRSAAPPVVILSDSDNHESLSRTRSPRRSPRARSTPPSGLKIFVSVGSEIVGHARVPKILCSRAFVFAVGLNN